MDLSLDGMQTRNQINPSVSYCANFLELLNRHLQHYFSFLILVQMGIVCNYNIHCIKIIESITSVNHGRLNKSYVGFVRIQLVVTMDNSGQFLTVSDG